MGRKKLQEKDLYMAHGNVGNLNAKKEKPSIYRLVGCCDRDLKDTVLKTCKQQGISESQLVTSAVKTWLKPLN
jgi:hypothetical protein